MIRKALAVIVGALAITLGVAGSAAAAVGTTTNVLGSGANHVGNTQLQWSTWNVGGVPKWHIDSGQNVRVWNPTGNDHGKLYAAVYFPASATSVNCTGESGSAATDYYYYLGEITDGATKIAPCTMANASSTANLRVQIQSVGESGGSLGTWCVSIRPNTQSATGGAC